MQPAILLACAVLVCNSQNSLVYTSDEVHEQSSQLRRGRLVASSTLRAANVVRHPLLNAFTDPDDDSATPSQSEEFIHQFIPFDSNSVQSGEKVECPNKSTCPSGMTCCLLSDDISYGCCPLPNAFCCDDKIHCCPNGSICDIKTEICLPKDKSMVASRLLKKLPSIPATRVIRKVGVMTTPAQVKCTALTLGNNRYTQTCPSGSTCCFDVKEDFALCCPYKDGVCCAADRSCCPASFKCTASGNCMAILHRNPLTDLDTILYSKHISTIPRPLFQSTVEESEPFNNDVTICGDGSECSGYATCCPIHNAVTGFVESYRCCGLSRATCCGASVDFCCPRGYNCSPGQRCERSALSDIFF